LPNQLKDKLLVDRLLTLELTAELAILELAELELTVSELDASELSDDSELLLATLDELAGAEDAALLAGIDAVPEPPPPQALKVPTTARANRILGALIVDALRLCLILGIYLTKTTEQAGRFCSRAN
jgi:hypothetical protein